MPIFKSGIGLGGRKQMACNRAHTFAGLGLSGRQGRNRQHPEALGRASNLDTISIAGRLDLLLARDSKDSRLAQQSRTLRI